MRAETLQLLFTKLWAGRRGIAAGFGPILLVIKIQHQEFSAHGFDLLGDLGTHIKRTNDGTQTGRCANRGQAGNPGTNDQNFRRRNLARGSDLARKEAAKLVTRFNHRTVACDIGHGGQRIHFLRAANARHHVHGNYCGLGLHALL